MKYIVINMALYKITDKDFKEVEAIDMYDTDKIDAKLLELADKYTPIQKPIDVHMTDD